MGPHIEPAVCDGPLSSAPAHLLAGSAAMEQPRAGCAADSPPCTALLATIHLSEHLTLLAVLAGWSPRSPACKNPLIWSSLGGPHLLAVLAGWSPDSPACKTPSYGAA